MIMNYKAISKKEYQFRRTAAQTAAANNAEKLDNKNVIDYSYIIDQINAINWNEYNNLNLSAAGIIELYELEMQQPHNKQSFNSGLVMIRLETRDYIIWIEAFTNHYCIYDPESGKQLYKYHTAENCRVYLFKKGIETAVYAETFNPVNLQAAGRYIEVNLHKEAAEK